MRTIATYLVAILVFVLAFFVAKLALTMLFGTLLKTVMIVACALFVVAVGAATMMRKR